MFPKVSIIILNWNGEKDTIECLNSLKHIIYPNYVILLVDNGSIDGSVEYFRKKYPDIEIIENGRNMGFAEGCNIGIRRSLEKGANYVLLLNNDTTVEPNFLDEMVTLAESKKDIGIVGPKICYYDEKNKISRAGEKINTITGKVTINKRDHIDDETNTRDKNGEMVDIVEGSCFLIRSNLFDKIGLLDPEYFAYSEDIDYCLRAKKNNFDVYCCHSSKIYHKGSRSSSSCLRTYLMIRNLTLMLAKNTNLFNMILYMIIYVFMLFPRFIFYSITLKNPIDSMKILHNATLWNIKRIYTGKYMEDTFLQDLLSK